MVSAGTSSVIVKPGIRAELAGNEFPVTSVGDTLSVGSILFMCGLKVTEVDCV